jgi:hypothetical protein
VIDLSTPDYERLIPLFSDNLGTVRDIYVTDTDVQTWEKLLVALRESPWDPELRLGEQPVEPVSAAEILADIPPDEDTYSLRVTVGESWLWCHFYTPDEIEFSFQASQVASARDLERLVAFMAWLSEVLEKDVKLTLEAPNGASAPPVLRVQPGTESLQVFPV